MPAPKHKHNAIHKPILSVAFPIITHASNPIPAPKDILDSFILIVVFSLLIFIYLPIQKLANILPSTSSFVISPVISARCWIDFLMSTDNKSPEIFYSIPLFTSLIAVRAFIKAS